MSQRITEILSSYTIADVQALRLEYGIGMMEARRMIDNDRLIKAIEAADSIADIKTILLAFISR